jgi:hypothetical protein
LYALQYIIRVIETRRMRWVGDIARIIRDTENRYKIFVGKPERRTPL